MAGKYRQDSLFATEEDAQEKLCSRIIRVVFDSGADTEFDYLLPEKIGPVEMGQRVEVPLGKNNKLQAGFCVEVKEKGQIEKRSFRLKAVKKIIDRTPLIDSALMELARWISAYYVCPLGQVLAAIVPAAVKKCVGVKTENYLYLVDKTPEQPKGKKQKQLVELLQESNACTGETALLMRDVLDKIGCTNAPVKSLVEKQIIKITRRTVTRALPVIPEGLSIKTGKVNLNDDQQKALTHINSKIEAEKFSVTLLHGVTDSGKTELYIRAIKTCLQKGKGAIVLLPEIALTAQTVQRFAGRFEKIAVMHSGLTAAQRNNQWQKIKAGEAGVVIGARSAVFAPLPKVGLIVVDEEHEPGYKQDTVPRYNGRDVAIKRAQLADAHCILGSATPSLETLFNCRSKKHFSVVHLPKRVMDLPMPEMKLVDLQKGFSTHKGFNLITEPLAEQLRGVLGKSEQAILLLNRRGYSNFVFCPACRYSLHCRNCDVALTFHKSPAGSETNKMRTVTGSHMNYGYAVCHYCMAQTLVPRKCPLCGAGLTMIGIGSQRLEEELADKFPNARVARIDSDSMTGKNYYRLLKNFGDGRIDILAGTQMLAKGLHFPNVTLVGIISADTCLYLPDFRANERTFQLISQVAGRTGRSAKKGIVFVQSFLAGQPAIQFALRNDFEGFIKAELKHRKACNLPPYWRLAIIHLQDRDFEKLEVACSAMRERIDNLVEQNGLAVNIRGPMPSIINRIQQFHRMQIIVQAEQAVTMQRLFTSLRAAVPIKPAVRIAVDIDPVNLL